MGADASSATRNLADGLPAFTLQVGGLFVVVSGPDEGKSVPFRDKPVAFGSSPTCDLVLTDDTVSRRHLIATLDPPYVLLRDQGSTNGSFVQEARFDEIRISYGAEFRIGCTTLKYLPDERAADPSPSAREAFGSMVGRSAKMRQLFGLLEEVGRHDATVLIEGKTGTGKELVAEELHRHSTRSKGPFVIFDCGAVPRELIASALFGHVKGSFTGAIGDRTGAFAEAHGGTILLDEIGELPLELQPTLLRVLDKRAVCRVGATAYEKVDVRIVAATNRDLRAEVAENRFREDLYYRLAVIHIRLPTLQEREEDVELLAEHFVRQFSSGRAARMTPASKVALLRHRWPGNVRELRNVIERACLLSKDGMLDVGSAFAHAEPAPIRTDLPFKEARDLFARSYLEDLLRRHGTNLSAAARAAGLDRKYLRELIRRYQVDVGPASADDRDEGP